MRSPDTRIASNPAGRPPVGPDGPETIDQALRRMDDAYRVMLLAAARGDKHARRQTIATVELWWESMPQAIRNNLDFKAAAWRRDHPHVTDALITARRVDMMLAEVAKRPPGRYAGGRGGETPPGRRIFSRPGRVPA